MTLYIENSKDATRKLLVAAQLLSHVQLWDPTNCSTPGFPVLHHLLEFVQTHVHWVDDAIQLSHPLSPPSPPNLNLSQHESFPVSQLFASGGQSIGVSASTSVLPMNTRTDLLYDGLVRSPCSPRDSQESSPTPQFKSFNSLPFGILYGPNLTSVHLH